MFFWLVYSSTSRLKGQPPSRSFPCSHLRMLRLAHRSSSSGITSLVYQDLVETQWLLSDLNPNRRNWKVRLVEVEYQRSIKCTFIWSNESLVKLCRGVESELSVIFYFHSHLNCAHHCVHRIIFSIPVFPYSLDIYSAARVCVICVFI